jgi:hypothetical protein
MRMKTARIMSDAGRWVMSVLQSCEDNSEG